ncbi:MULTISPECIES: tetratricopeptide repeat protein [Nibribacter]|uniref:Tetratricopeptide repeat protein n=2 Tax=Nibribacter TaxID=1649474 RepID=A0A6P1NSU2_9BACT|nr:tetratricopeptide repeat protein [Nibribacter ruber]QHL86090.1 tetratricopeptide repeat protein [Nibribacter ruber]
METSNSRLAQLLAFYQDDPQDPFTLYAIATEYRAFDVEKARFFYEKLLAEHPDYVGTYYHAASLYLQLDEPTLAQQAYQKGMQVSRQQGQLHAFSELQGAYNKMMGLDYEDD